MPITELFEVPRLEQRPRFRPRHDPGRGSTTSLPPAARSEEIRLGRSEDLGRRGDRFALGPFDY